MRLRVGREYIGAVTPEDVRDVAERYLDFDVAVTGFLMKEEQGQ
jgi:hypothetical protein